eukprot:jgi/Ulvmu1/10889/UM007_0065.1
MNALDRSKSLACLLWRISVCKGLLSNLLRVPEAYGLAPKATNHSHNNATVILSQEHQARLMDRFRNVGILRITHAASLHVLPEAAAMGWSATATMVSYSQRAAPTDATADPLCTSVSTGS